MANKFLEEETNEKKSTTRYDQITYRSYISFEFSCYIVSMPPRDDEHLDDL